MKARWKERFRPLELGIQILTLLVSLPEMTLAELGAIGPWTAPGLYRSTRDLSASDTGDVGPFRRVHTVSIATNGSRSWARGGSEGGW